jgi:hypothetical protein
MRRFLQVCLDRTPLIGALMAALLFRALIPTGFMPTLGSDGTLVMELCSGFTTKSVVVHLGTPATQGVHAGHGHAGGDTDPAPADAFEHSPCGFAVAVFAAPPPAMLSLRAPALPAAPRTAFVKVVQFPPSILRSQSPRGPPFA